MAEKDENEDKIKDYLRKKFQKDPKNSFDALGIAAQMLNLANNRDITYSVLHKLGIISKTKNQDQKDSEFEQIMDYINKSNELKDIEFEDVKLVDYFKENKNDIFSFFEDFEKLTGNKEIPDFNTLKFICESDVMYTLYDKEVDRNVLDNFISSKLFYNEQLVSLGKGLDLMEKEYEDVQRYNWGQYPDNSIEIAEDIGIITMTAVAAAFPPFLIFAGIVHLFHANNNELTNECAKQYQEGKQNLKKYIMEKQQKSSAENIKSIRKETEKKSKERLGSLNEKLPESLKPYVMEYLDTASNATIVAHQKLRQYLNQFTMCNSAMNQAIMRNLPQTQQQLVP